jgi:cyanophycin synthetase
MRVTSMTVLPDRVDVVVKVERPERMRTCVGEGVAERALELLPGLASHRCSEADGRGFVEEMKNTEVPHLFEHLVLELMAEAGSPRDLKGETAWDFRRQGHGVFRVSVEYDDDLVALGAIKTAQKLIGYVLDGGERPDVATEMRRLSELRGWPAVRAS